MTDYYEQGLLQFRVRICKHSTSPAIQSGIWDSQHFCVTDEPERYLSDIFEDEPIISDASAGDGVIRHQLKVEHYSVLRQAFIKFKCYGFPHSTMSQAVRHHETAPLVTSMRYTGKNLSKEVKAICFLRLPFMFVHQAFTQTAKATASTGKNSTELFK